MALSISQVVSWHWQSPARLAAAPGAACIADNAAASAHDATAATAVAAATPSDTPAAVVFPMSSACPLWEWQGWPWGGQAI